VRRRTTFAVVGMALSAGLGLAACGPAATPGASSTHLTAHTGHRPVPALQVLSIAPRHTLSPSGTITVEMSAPIAANSADPVVRPAVAGSWAVNGTAFIFTPQQYYQPLAAYRVTVPAGVRSSDGATLGRARSQKVTAPAPTLLRAQQILARLGYLPLTTDAPVASTAAQEAAAAYAPAHAGFAWRYPNTPSLLREQWAPGVDTVMTKGAIMAFQNQNGLAVDGVLGPVTWRKLLADDAADKTDPEPYSYIEADLNLPQTLTVWRAGSVVVTSPVNGGVAAAPTPLGTFPIYERLTSTTMSGTNPDGSHYSDPGVPWVNYFSGGSAVHGFPRASYGWPQSVGCLELPIPTAARVYGLVDYGTLVTVYG
jgi:peptidoglycan hydrolase-like protein with peptidoglycan-binding domain